jgi:hypothetical protein
MFRAGVDLFARWADVRAEGSDFAGPSLLTASPNEETTRDVRGVLSDVLPGGGSWGEGWPERARSEARVVSLRGAKVARLTVSRLDMTVCAFAGAHGLDELRLEGVDFARPPTGWRRYKHLPVRWTTRQTIAEEHQWRCTAGYGHDWYEEAMRVPNARSLVLHPREIASIYRSLRRGREREHDEMAAGDFFYGESEMRRMAARLRGARSLMPVRDTERALLWLYWLLAGYGWRASRAFVALAVVLSFLSIPLAIWGFEPSQDYGRSLLFSAESSISLLRAPTAKLTPGGEVVQLALRLAGPLFFGLAVVALRNRVKR